MILTVLKIQVFDQWEIEQLRESQSEHAEVNASWKGAQHAEFFQNFQVKPFKAMLSEKCG